MEESTDVDNGSTWFSEDGVVDSIIFLGEGFGTVVRLSVDDC